MGTDVSSRHIPLGVGGGVMVLAGIESLELIGRSAGVLVTYLGFASTEGSGGRVQASRCPDRWVPSFYTAGDRGPAVTRTVRVKLWLFARQRAIGGACGGC